MSTNTPCPLGDDETAREKLDMEVERMMNEFTLQHGASPDEVYTDAKTSEVLTIIGAISHGFEGGIDVLRGLNILDLGCGSIETAGEENPNKPKDFEPWVARFLHSAGAHVVGIDIGDISREEFQGHRIDLSKYNALGFLPSDSFDVVRMKSLLHEDAPSPGLVGTMARNQNRSDDEGFAGYMINMMEMNIEIRRQALRLLREGGVFIYDVKAYKKVGGVFVEHLTGME